MPLRAVTAGDWVIKKGNLTASLFYYLSVESFKGIAHIFLENTDPQKETNKILNHWQSSYSFLCLWL